MLLTAYKLVAVLPFSMYCYVEAGSRMDSKNWINCHIHAFEYFGGVSRIVSVKYLYNYIKYQKIEMRIRS